MKHTMLTKIGNKLVNLDQFVAFEFDDDSLCMWAYLPRLRVCGEGKLEYTGFVCDTQHEYDDLKARVNTLVDAGDTTGSHGYTPPVKDHEQLLVETLPKPPVPPRKSPFKNVSIKATTTRPPTRKFGK